MPGIGHRLKDLQTTTWSGTLGLRLPPWADYAYLFDQTTGSLLVTTGPVITLTAAELASPDLVATRRSR